MKKKILFLGAGIFQIPPIVYAKKQGYHVITCDYLPNNPGHKFSDEYINASTIDKESILRIAQQKKIDGIISYASDVSAPTAAYVGNKLGLPSNPYESVVTMTRKDLFRKFLQDNNFPVPRSGSFDNYNDAYIFFDSLKMPVMVKPVDSSGSKGVSRISNKADLANAFDHAINYSINKRIVMEEFIQRKGYQIAGDGFLVDSKLAFYCFANEHFDKLGNPHVPIGESFPCIASMELQKKAAREIQRIINLLGMNIGALNFDLMIDDNDDVYILEIGPRNGGNLIPEVTKYATGIDMVRHTVEIAIGNDCSDVDLVDPKGYFSSYIVHSNNPGELKQVNFSDRIKENIVEKYQTVNLGEKINSFSNASLGIGALILKFNSRDEMLDRMDNMEKYINVEVAPQ